MTLVISLKDNTGRIIAYCEMRVVGPSGYEIQDGEYLWVNDMWAHLEFRKTGIMGRMIDEIMIVLPQINYCYFQRKDKNERVRIYSRRNWERRRKSHYPLMTGDI